MAFTKEEIAEIMAEIDAEAAAGNSSIAEPIPATEPESDYEASPSDVAIQLSQGLTAGHADEIGGGLATVADTVRRGGGSWKSIKDTYLEIRDSIRDKDEKFTEEHPATSVALNIGGGMLPVSKAMNKVSTLKGIAAIGAGYGLGDYVGNLKGYGDFNISKGIQHAGIGAALPLLLRGGAGIAKHIFKTPTSKAKNIARQIVEDSEGGMEGFIKKGSDLSPDTTIANIIGKPAISSLDGAQNVNPKVTRIIRDNIENTPYKNKIKKVMVNATEKGEREYHETLSGLKASKKEAAKELFDKAEETDVITNAKMQSLYDDTPVFKKIVDDVDDSAARHNITLSSTKRAQNIKYELDAKIANRSRGNVTSTEKDELRALKKYRKEFLDEVYEQNPAFKKANSKYAGDSAIENAQEMGMKHGLGGAKIDDQMDFIKELNSSEADAYLQGAMSNSFGRMGTSAEDVLTGLNRMSSENATRVLDELMPGASGKIKREILKQKQLKSVSEGLSKVADKGIIRKAQEDIGSLIKPGVVEQAYFTTPGMVRSASNEIFELIRLGNKPKAKRFAEFILKQGSPAELVQEMVEAGYSPENGGKFVKMLMAMSIPEATSLIPTNPETEIGSEQNLMSP